jgi:hypothetical protein
MERAGASAQELQIQENFQLKMCLFVGALKLASLFPVPLETEKAPPGLPRRCLVVVLLETAIIDRNRHVRRDRRRVRRHSLSGEPR